MFKFIFQLIGQFVLLLIISFFLLFRNDGAGAKWVMYETPQMLTQIEQNLWAWDQEFFGGTFREALAKNGGLKFPGRNDGETGEIAGGIQVNLATINQLYTAMENAGIVPIEGQITVWVPLDATVLAQRPEPALPAPTVMTANTDPARPGGELLRKLAGEAFLIQAYREISGNAATDTPVVKVDGTRFFGQVRGSQPDGAQLELTLQLEGDRGHLAAVLRQPLPDLVRGAWPAQLKKLTERADRCEMSVSLNGVRPGILGLDEQEKIITGCLTQLQAKKVETAGRDGVLVSAYSPLLPAGICLGRENINLQVLVRYHGIDRQTHFVFGYPLLIQET
ncbi:MAG: YwmB family TATA-box binding protein [Heliobacteriaceae bacterium]|nr:YwmB family TATA-box binding protein [Heliobacteriaceae bacterium]